MQITKQSVNELIGYLERQGYLRRVVDPDDSRARIIHLPPRGQALGIPFRLGRARTGSVRAGRAAVIARGWAAEVMGCRRLRRHDQMSRSTMTGCSAAASTRMYSSCGTC